MSLLVAVTVAAAVPSAPRNNVPIAAGLAIFWTAVVIVVSEWLVLHRLRTRRSFIVCVIVAACIGGAIGNWFRLSSDYAFRVIFDCPLPAGIHDLDVGGLFIGSRSDQVICVNFVADEATVSKLISQRPLERDREAEKDIASSRTEPGRWKRVFGVGGVDQLANPEWRTTQFVSEPHIYRWRGSDVEWVTIVWEPTTGRVFAVYWFG